MATCVRWAPFTACSATGSALVRISASKAQSACDDCMDCFAVCPEPQVIRPALKQVGQEAP